MKENLKIRVNDDNRQEIIDLLGKLGKSFCWDVKTRWSEIVAIFAYKKQNLEWDSDLGCNCFKGHSNKEITLPELRELAREKEYLNDKFKLVVTNQPKDGWRLVPDGAQYFTEYPKFASHLFWKTENDISYCYPISGNDWVRGDMNMAEYIEYWSGTKILWQRTPQQETIMKEEKKGRFLHQEWYEAFGRGEDVQFKLTHHSDNQWKTLSTHSTLEKFNENQYEFRIKPQTITIGSRTINKPISVKPENNKEFFIPDLFSDKKYARYIWQGNSKDIQLLNNNLCHLTKEDAVAQTEATFELFALQMESK